MTPRTHAAPRTPAAAVVALALLASASVGALPASSTAPLERVVVTGAGAAQGVLRAGGEVLDQLPLVTGVGALLPRGARLPAGLHVVPDRSMSVQSAGATSTTAPTSTVRATLGLGAPDGEGRGVTVAVVDTGVADLPDLAGRVEHVSVVGETDDGLGHGTFIAGLVASSGASTGGATAGVAPGARVLDVKVARHDGSTSLLDVLRGLQAVKTRGDVDVLNLSLSSDSPLPSGVDPLSVALDRLWEDGTTVVVPSGNDADTVSTPGDDPLLLTVGGLAEGGTGSRTDDVVAAWSGRGGSKPDLVAPGQSLLSLVAPGSEAAAAAARRSDLPAGHGLGSGTSFATAVTSGAAAVLLAERPTLGPDQLKALVTGSAYRTRSLRSGAGAGGLDVAAALDAPTPKAKAGQADWRVPAPFRAEWEAFVAAVLAEDAEAAASSWSAMSPQARTWGARTWGGITPEARTWGARTWGARTWGARTWGSHPDGADAWAARTWGARTWAARTWGASDWSARTWGARTWGTADWSARTWSDTDWEARTWSARTWSARTWSTTSWE
ncbi:MAG: hypothetical protein JWO60_822 [Frankiales bacterium]|nr:hypothetical protein [Frankiales bacterium]